MNQQELLIWNDRLNEIKQASSPIKTARLNNFMQDLEKCYELDNDNIARNLYMIAGEELSESIKS